MGKLSYPLCMCNCCAIGGSPGRNAPVRRQLRQVVQREAVGREVGTFEDVARPRHMVVGVEEEPANARLFGEAADLRGGGRGLEALDDGAAALDLRRQRWVARALPRLGPRQVRAPLGQAAEDE